MAKDSVISSIASPLSFFAIRTAVNVLLSPVRIAKVVIPWAVPLRVAAEGLLISLMILPASTSCISVAFFTTNVYKAASPSFSTKGSASNSLMYGFPAVCPVAPVVIRQISTRHRHNLRGIFILRTHPKPDNLITQPPIKTIATPRLFQVWCPVNVNPGTGVV